MAHIAHLDSISSNLDTVAKLIRVLGKEGVASSDLFLPMDNKNARKNLAAFLKAGCPELREKPLEPLFSVANANVQLSAHTLPFNPTEFYHTREGLYVSGDFKSFLLAEKPLSRTHQAVVAISYDLLRDATDHEMLVALSEKNDWLSVEVFARMARLIEEQPGGETGKLVNTGEGNIFYTPRRVITVCWDGFARAWRVDEGPLGAHHRRGSRVFCGY